MLDDTTSNVMHLKTWHTCFPGAVVGSKTALTNIKYPFFQWHRILTDIFCVQSSLFRMSSPSTSVQKIVYMLSSCSTPAGGSDARFIYLVVKFCKSCVCTAHIDIYPCLLNSCALYKSNRKWLLPREYSGFQDTRIDIYFSS